MSSGSFFEHEDITVNKLTVNTIIYLRKLLRSQLPSGMTLIFLEFLRQDFRHCYVHNNVEWFVKWP